MSYPEVNIGYVANVYSRQMLFKKAGDVEHGHKHNFDHMTLLASGSLQIEIEGQKTEFKAPHMIFIGKDKHHELTALEDNTVAYCIHAIRDADGSGDILSPDMIPKGLKHGVDFQGFCSTLNPIPNVE
jgi:quercetin dioxygenase-like cupin family protein